VEAGIVAADVGTSVSVTTVDCGTGVSAKEGDVMVSVGCTGVTVFVAGWQAASTLTIKTKNLFKR
jgi:hypothetical protein